jgi:hypothetical protein
MYAITDSNVTIDSFCCCFFLLLLFTTKNSFLYLLSVFSFLIVV